MSQPTAEQTVVPPLPKPSTNPGSYEELHRKARDVFPTCFEGAKVMVSKGLSSHFQHFAKCWGSADAQYEHVVEVDGIYC
ncbi:unnamed protein product [Strongylus vulgaris]|uniref:Uncharacterized protein n=1 Tax=Strongylus vulgaris TaxID=40348 RepID=A0A3P7LJT1_STRVU|nr:unnamed protein product [Strongylus vulgaris]